MLQFTHFQVEIQIYGVHEIEIDKISNQHYHFLCVTTHPYYRFTPPKFSRKKLNFYQIEEILASHHPEIQFQEVSQCRCGCNFDPHANYCYECGEWQE